MDGGCFGGGSVSPVVSDGAMVLFEMVAISNMGP